MAPSTAVYGTQPVYGRSVRYQPVLDGQYPGSVGRAIPGQYRRGATYTIPGSLPPHQQERVPALPYPVGTTLGTRHRTVAGRRHHTAVHGGQGQFCRACQERVRDFLVFYQKVRTASFIIFIPERCAHKATEFLHRELA